MSISVDDDDDDGAGAGGDGFSGAPRMLYASFMVSLSLGDSLVDIVLAYRGKYRTAVDLRGERMLTVDAKYMVYGVVCQSHA